MPFFSILDQYFAGLTALSDVEIRRNAGPRPGTINKLLEHKRSLPLIELTRIIELIEIIELIRIVELLQIVELI